jgi:hypothetical protein
MAWKRPSRGILNPGRWIVSFEAVCLAEDLEKPMRLLIPLLFVVAAVLLVEPQATLAEAHAYRWCSIENAGTGPGGRRTCAYDSFEQCVAARPGAGVLCIQNSLYGPQAPAPYYRRPSTRKHKNS